MISIVEIDSKKTRAFGWVQDSGNLDSLCDVVAIFDETSDFHKMLKTQTLPSLVKDEKMRSEMFSQLNTRPVSLTYKILTGRRCKTDCTGIVQAAVKGQKGGWIVDWAADNFLRWAQAFGFISYNYNDDTFSITESGKRLVHSEDKKELLIKAALSYPPAYRILSFLKNPETVLTKYEIGEQFGFVGEEGFIFYPVASVVAALSNAENDEGRKKIKANWESTSDKYARTICQWLIKLGLLEKTRKEVSAFYGNTVYSETFNAFRITPKGEKYLRNSTGNSRHRKMKKNVSYEMFSLMNGKEKDYIRFRRSLILKFLAEHNRVCKYEEISKFLLAYGLEENLATICDDIKGFENLGLEIIFTDDGAKLKDSICDFSIPHYKDLSEKSELTAEKDSVRSQLKNIPHEYLSLMDLAFDGKQDRLFEMKFMELFLRECNFNGDHLGGVSKPDGALFTDFDDGNYGIIIDTKAYSKGYDLPRHQQDEMLRYIQENISRNKAQNPNEWWKIFPDNLTKFYFMFVSGSFKGDIAGKLEKVAAVHGVDGTAMPIVQALLAADKMKGGKMTFAQFAAGIRNTEYEI